MELFFPKFFLLRNLIKYFLAIFYFHFLRIFWNAFWSNREQNCPQYHLWWQYGLLFKNFQLKIDHFAKNKNCKNQEKNFQRCQTLRIFLDIFLYHFGWFILLHFFITYLCTKFTISQEIKIGKLFFIGFRTLRIFVEQNPSWSLLRGGSLTRISPENI